MNCWFCDHPVKGPYCNSQPCRSASVTYMFGEHESNHETHKFLYKVEFKAWLVDGNRNLRTYYVTYRIPGQTMCVIERVDVPRAIDDESVSITFDWKRVFEIPYKTTTLTPDNYKDKLPILLALS